MKLRLNSSIFLTTIVNKSAVLAVSPFLFFVFVMLSEEDKDRKKKIIKKYV